VLMEVNQHMLMPILTETALTTGNSFIDVKPQVIAASFPSVRPLAQSLQPKLFNPSVEFVDCLDPINLPHACLPNVVAKEEHNSEEVHDECRYHDSSKDTAVPTIRNLHASDGHSHDRTQRNEDERHENAHLGAVAAMSPNAVVV
jgi:hypothetical protein